jgi:hypothetical protein
MSFLDARNPSRCLRGDFSRILVCASLQRAPHHRMIRTTFGKTSALPRSSSVKKGRRTWKFAAIFEVCGLLMSKGAASSSHPLINDSHLPSAISSSLGGPRKELTTSPIRENAAIVFVSFVAHLNQHMDRLVFFHQISIFALQLPNLMVTVLGLLSNGRRVVSFQSSPFRRFESLFRRLEQGRGRDGAFPKSQRPLPNSGLSMI